MTTPIDHHSPIPLHVQIERYLRQMIQQEKYQNGKLLPGEWEMANAFGVSRNTYRTAIDKLVRDGLVVRKKGIGTMVNRRRISTTLERWSGFSEEMSAQGIAMELLSQSVSWVSADDEVAFDMGVKAGTRLCRLERIRGIDGQPVVLFLSYFHPRVGIHAQEDFSGPLYDVLEKRYNAHAHISNEEISALPLNDYLSDKLRLRENVPVLLRKRHVLNRGEKLLELCYAYYRSDKFVYNVQFKKD
ncbi:MAG: GntR family transcriptional regulator [Eubacteriales bacterium]|nr:GntR family transcriptional regulator [Eubacteriales bacterium]